MRKCSKLNPIEAKKSILIGAAVFVALTVLTQLLTYQQYLIYKRSELANVSQEANAKADKLKSSLSNSLSATKTLAFIVSEYGVPEQFDSVAASILGSNKFIDALELTQDGVITHVYPHIGNENVIGYNVLADSTRNEEAFEAIRRNELFFAGPFELRQGGMAVVGRLPIIKDSTFFGFSAVLIKFTTLVTAAGIDTTSEYFRYQLSKVDPLTGNETFFLTGDIPSDGHFVAVEVPDGEWNLYVIRKDSTGYLVQVLPFGILGVALSVVAGLFGWHFARQPEKLRARIDQVIESLQHVNRFYHFTSMTNHMVVHATNDQELFRQICQIATSVGKFKMAWVGLLDEENRHLHAVCSSGDVEGYLQTITPIPAEDRDAELPLMRMLNTGRHVYFNDIATDPLMKPWAETALKRGYRSSILLPIRKHGKIIGSFNLYSGRVNGFDQSEIQLLLEATGNVSFALENIDNELKRKLAEKQIRTEKLLSDSIINSLPGIFYFYDRQGRFLRWNKNFETVSGYSADEVRRMHPLDFFQGEDQRLLEQKINAVFDRGYDDVVAEFYTKDNRKIPHFFNGRKVTFNGVDYLIGMGLDVSDQVRAENELRERTSEIERLTSHLQNIREEERAHIALEIHDVLGQQLTALKMDATWIRKKTETPSVTDRVSSMIILIDDTIKTVRRIASELRPGILDDLGLVPALEWQGAEFEKNTGIALKFSSSEQDIEVDREVATNVFRIYQEALTNIARHSEATMVHASLIYHPDRHIQLIIRDNGRGIDFEQVKTKKSLGLISMRARARLFKGEVLVENLVPQGTIVTVNVPLQQTERILSS